LQTDKAKVQNRDEESSKTARSYSEADSRAIRALGSEADGSELWNAALGKANGVRDMSRMNREVQVRFFYEKAVFVKCYFQFSRLTLVS